MSVSEIKEATTSATAKTIFILKKWGTVECRLLALVDPFRCQQLKSSHLHKFIIIYANILTQLWSTFKQLNIERFTSQFECCARRKRSFRRKC